MPIASMSIFDIAIDAKVRSLQRLITTFMPTY
jgi:hypothetical protein